MVLLYHSFPRAATMVSHRLNGKCGNNFSISESGALDILDSILDSGILLTPEHISIPWDDPYGTAKANELKITQFRFCLTALNNNEDIVRHSTVFGPIALGFSTHIVRKLGGFPVFYLPSPIIDNSKELEYFDKVGVSLLYRIAEIRAILESIEKLPKELKNTITSHSADFDNTIGAIRFIGNILYLTDNLKKNDPDELRYYRQQEWRIIAGLDSHDVKMSVTSYHGNIAYIISAIGVCSISKYIEEIAIVGTHDDKKHVEKHLAEEG